MSLINKLTQQIARSDKGKQLIDRAQEIANDPKNRAKVDGARQRIEGRVDAVKRRLAGKRGQQDAAGDAGRGTATATDPATTPTPPAPATSPPTEADYGGDEGPKAA